jgi:hypothetical protein
VALARLLFRLDRRLVAGALGIGAAILLPVAGTLVLAGLEAHVDSAQGWVAYRTDGAGLDLAGLPAPRVALAEQDYGGARIAAYRVGGPAIAEGTVQGLPEAGDPPAALLAVAPTVLSRGSAPLAAPDRFLVNSSLIPQAPVTMALFDGPVAVPGAVVVPARGADAFEEQTIRDVAASTWVLLAASVPAVALVAVAFAVQEVRDQRGTSAALVALGGARWARALVAGRVLLVSGLGLAASALAAAALWAAGKPFHPHPFPVAGILLSFAFPGIAAALAGLAVSARALTDVQGVLRAPAGPAAQPRWPGPAMLRPLLLGSAVVPVLVASGLLFAFDVGFPVAVSQVPSALVGGPGEYILGAEEGLQIGAGIDASVADVAGLDPAVQGISAETPVPTLVDGHAAVVRGGNWTALAAYHGLDLVEGHPPGPGEAIVGQGLARRLGVQPGDIVHVQGGARPWMLALTVVGKARGPDLLNDEVLVAPETARSLAGLPAGQAALVRFRPQTEAARMAVQRVDPALAVTRLEAPKGAVAGDLAHAVVTVANLGAKEGERTLTLRVDGQGVASQVARVPGHSIRSFSLPFLVPPGAYTLAVNPSAGGTAAAGTLAIQVPASALVGQGFQVRLLEGESPAADRRVGLFADAQAADNRSGALATATTGADGNATLVAGRAGLLYVGTLDGPRAFATVAVAKGPGPDIVVESAWSVPPVPVPGQEAQVFATVRNRGAQGGTAQVHFFAGGALFHQEETGLGAGGQVTLQARLVLSAPVDQVRVENVTVDFRSIPFSAPPTPPATVPVPATGVRTGESLEGQIADRVLGDARAALGGVAATALASTLALVFLATDRSLRSRSHVAGILEALGQDEQRIRRRAALEAAGLGGGAMLAALIPAKLLYIAGHALGRPAPFAHAVPDPVSALFAVQTTAAFAAACALAAFLAAGPVLRRSPLRPGTRSGEDELPAVSLHGLLEGPR